MNRLISLFVLILVIFILIGCQIKKIADEEIGLSEVNFLIYNGNNISIIYPSNWSFEQGSNNEILGFQTVFLSNQYPLASISVKRSNLVELQGHGNNLNNYTKWIENRVTNFSQGTIINSSDTTLSGNPAHEIIYTLTGPRNDTHTTIIVYTIKEGHIYTITYYGTKERSYEKNSEIRNKIIKSFTIK